MSEKDRAALQFCEAGVEHMWRGEIEAALAAYDRALADVESEESRELITIRKAEALIAAEREGPEVNALPAIVMRRRSPRHVYLAAGSLMRRWVELDDRRKAIFYGEVAREAASELSDPMAHASILNHLGIAFVTDSQFGAAIAVLDESLAILPLVKGRDEQTASLRSVVLGNLGGAKVLSGDLEDGIRILLAVLPRLDEEYTIAEAYLDLCFAHIEIEQYDAAEKFGRHALRLAIVKRQVRNANHFLGEICVRTGRHEDAEAFFEVVATFYPDFKNLKQLLAGVDLCSVVNWKV